MIVHFNHVHISVDLRPSSSSSSSSSSSVSPLSFFSPITAALPPPSPLPLEMVALYVRTHGHSAGLISQLLAAPAPVGDIAKKVGRVRAACVLNVIGTS
jgi:hypothetical protein